MITLSAEEYAVFQTALMRAWECAMRKLPVTGGNAEHVANVLMQGACEALEAGERKEASIAAAALARLHLEQTAEFVLGLKNVYPASPTIH